jgi:NIPSNAP
VAAITCHVRYEIDASQIEAFERFARRWMELVARHGGTHHGYFLPSEGASDIAYALFSFPSLADYERYRAVRRGPGLRRGGPDPRRIGLRPALRAHVPAPAAALTF